MENNSVQKVKQFGAMAGFACLMGYIMQSGLSTIYPAIATLAAEYAEVDISNIMLVATIPTLLACIGHFIADSFVRKIGYKWTTFLGFLGYVIFGILPALIGHNFTALIVCRVFFGIFYGLSFPLGAASVMAFFTGDRQSRLLGYGTTASNISSIILGPVGGFFATISVNAVWWGHLIFCIPMLISLLIPSKKYEPESHQTAKFSLKISRRVVFYVVFYGLVFVFAYPFYLYNSSIITLEGLGNATQAGLLTTISSITGAVAGVLFGLLVKVIRKRIMVIGGFILAAGMLTFNMGHSYLLLCVGAGLFGLGFSMLLVWCYFGISQDANSDEYTRATALMVIVGGIACFVAPYIAAFWSNMAGIPGDMRFPFLVGTIVLAAFSVVMLIKPWRVGLNKQNEQ